MYENIGSRISKEAARDIEYLAQEEKSDKSKVIRELVAFALKEKMIEIAVRKYASKEISLGRAAELAKVPLADFMAILFERKVSVNYSINSLQEDFKAAIKKRGK